MKGAEARPWHIHMEEVAAGFMLVTESGEA